MRGENLARAEKDPRPVRITPACAGKTYRSYAVIVADKDHPRMRGENTTGFEEPGTTTGSPPHARGRPTPVSRLATSAGITPACAGKTRHAVNRDAKQPWITPACAGKTVRLGRAALFQRDHPRMRGEDLSFETSANNASGSPPHARGRRTPAGLNFTAARITPACAGKTRGFHFDDF